MSTIRPYQPKPKPELVIRPVDKHEEFEFFTGRYDEDALIGWKEPLMIIPGFCFRVFIDHRGTKTFSGLGGALKSLEARMENFEDFDPTSYKDTREGFTHPMNTPIEMINMRTGEVVTTGYLEYMYDYVKYLARQYKLNILEEMQDA